MNIQIYGDRRKPAALFLHGYGAHPKLYKSFIDRLAENFAVYVPEIFGLNGFCRIGFDENLEATYDLMRTQNLLESVVIGHSYGALVAMHVAAEFASVKKAIAVNPLLPQIFNVDKFRQQLMNLQRDLNFATGELRGMLTNPVVGLTYGSNVIQNPLGYVEGAARAVQSRLPEKKSAVPVEILYADLDTLFHLEDTDFERWRQALPNLKFVPVPDYSHNWLIYHGAYAYEKIFQQRPQ